MVVTSIHPNLILTLWCACTWVIVFPKVMRSMEMLDGGTEKLNQISFFF